MFPGRKFGQPARRFPSLDHRYGYLLIFLLGSTLLPGVQTSYSKQEPPEALRITAERLYYSFDWKVIWSEEDTLISIAAQTLTAQNVVIDLNDWKIKAWGQVGFGSGTTRLEGDELVADFLDGAFVIRKFGTKIEEDCYNLETLTRLPCDRQPIAFTKTIPSLPSELLNSLLVIETQEIVTKEQVRMRCTPATFRIKGVIYPSLPKFSCIIGELPTKRGFRFDRFGVGSYRGLLSQASYHYVLTPSTGSLSLYYESGLKNDYERNLFKVLVNNNLKLSDYAAVELDGWIDDRERYWATAALKLDRQNRYRISILGKFLDELYGPARNEARIDALLNLTERTDLTWLLSAVNDRNLEGSLDLEHRLTGRLTTGITAGFFDRFADYSAYRNRKSAFHMAWNLTKFSGRIDYRAAWDLPQRWIAHGPGLTLNYRTILVPNSQITLVTSDSLNYEMREWDKNYSLTTNHSQLELTTGKYRIFRFLGYEQKILLAHVWTKDREQSIATDYTLALDLTVSEDVYASVVYFTSGLWDAEELPGFQGDARQTLTLDGGLGTIVNHVINLGLTWDMELNRVANLSLDGARKFGQFWEAGWRLKFDLARHDFMEHEYKLTRTFRTFNLNFVVDLKSEDFYVDIVSVL